MAEQLVRQAVDAFMARDLDGILAVADEEIVLRSLLTEAERPLYQIYGWGLGYELARSSSSGSSTPRRTPSPP
jgi:hypothetical protein